MARFRIGRNGQSDGGRRWGVMMSVTIDTVLRWQPCDPPYTREYVTSLFAGRKMITALDVLDMDIPHEDKLWAVLREDMIREHGLQELACRFVEDVLPLYEQQFPGDDRPRRAIEVKRLWLRGEATNEELVAAWTAAAWAVRAAADVADVAWAAATEAAWEKQVEIVREYLEAA